MPGAYPRPEENPMSDVPTPDPPDEPDTPDQPDNGDQDTNTPSDEDEDAAG